MRAIDLLTQNDSLTIQNSPENQEKNNLKFQLKKKDYINLFGILTILLVLPLTVFLTVNSRQIQTPAAETEPCVDA